MDIKESRKLLEVSGVLCEDWDSDEEGTYIQALNMGDTWAWALTWIEPISDEELPEVAELFKNYGYAGLLYWVSKKNNNMRSEFEDINRFVDFVRNEERIKLEEPDWNKRAYYKSSYTLGL